MVQYYNYMIISLLVSFVPLTQIPGDTTECGGNILPVFLFSISALWLYRPLPVISVSSAAY